MFFAYRHTTANITHLSIMALVFTTLTACQSVPQQPPLIIDKSGKQANTQSIGQPPSTHTKNTDSIEKDNPYATSKPTIRQPPAITSSSTDNTTQQKPTAAPTLNTPPAVVNPAAAILQAQRQNQQRQFNDGSHIPAYKHLINQGINSLNNNQLGNAENSFIRAQRIAPQAATVYYYLAQVALKKGQGGKAEAMARRGLLVNKDNNLDKKLWQIVALSGQLRNNPQLIKEAQQHINNN